MLAAGRPQVNSRHFPRGHVARNIAMPSNEGVPMVRSSPRSLRRMRGDILFGPLFFLGIIAAIAIPAYQDYTIRSQVTEGLNLASGVKAAVAEYFATKGVMPANLRALEFDRTPRGHYVASVTVKNGVVVIRYGGRANLLLADRQLTLHPTVSPQKAIIWNCGYTHVPAPDPAKGAAAPPTTDVLPKYLPSACR